MIENAQNLHEIISIISRSIQDILMIVGALSYLVNLSCFPHPQSEKAETFLGKVSKVLNFLAGNLDKFKK